MLDLEPATWPPTGSKGSRSERRWKVDGAAVALARGGRISGSWFATVFRS